MSLALRKLTLTVHVVSSVGWLGAVAAFLALAVAGLRSSDEQVVRGAYLAMNVVTWFVIVPASLASFASGVVQSIGTPWGLFKHYWVVIKLVLTVLSTAFLLLHTRPIAYLANVVAERSIAAGDLTRPRIQLLVDSAAAIIVLLVTTVLAVYKPRGLTPIGRRSK